MERIKLKQMPIGFTPRHRKMIEEIMKNDGGATYLTISSVVQNALVLLYNTLKKDGKEN